MIFNFNLFLFLSLNTFHGIYLLFLVTIAQCNWCLCNHMLVSSNQYNSFWKFKVTWAVENIGRRRVERCVETAV